MSIKGKLGIVMLPAIFGPSKSFTGHVADLSRELGSSAEVIIASLYAGSAPKFAPYVLLPGATEKRAALAESIDDEAVTGRIIGAASALLARGSSRIALLGFGYGGLAAIRAAIAMNAKTAGSVVGVVAWYPQLVPPASSRKTAPLLHQLDCPGLLFYGTGDTETGASRKVALAVAGSHPGLSVEVYRGVGHGFADRFLQGNFPSSQYQREVGPQSWGTATYWLRSLARQLV